MADVHPEAEATLRGLATGDEQVLEGMLARGVDDREEDPELDRRARALVVLGALVAIGAPQAAFTREVAAALAAGLTAGDVTSVLAVVAPHVGSARLIDAAPLLLVALGLPPAGDVEWPP